jgi:plastocyanin
VLALLSGPVRAGDIVGTIQARGKEGAAGGQGGGAYESRKFKFAERVNYDGLRDFVVYVDQPVAGTFSPPEQPLRVVVQKDAAFLPHVLPVLAGTTVEWPNYDDIYHNAFSFSETKPFDLELYKEEVKQVTFDKPGRVDVFCSIHSKMHCIILVLENPFFAAADDRNQYRITGVPAGTYNVRAWHERLPSQVREVTVPEVGEARLDFEMGISGLPKY